MNFKKLLTLAVIVASTFSTYAQKNLEFWPYEKKSIPERKVIEHRYTSEANVKYHKRIQRVIDLRQKQNKPMVWPKSNIVEILHRGALLGPNTEEGFSVYKSPIFTKDNTYSIAEAKGRGSDTIEVDVIIDDIGNTRTDSVPQPLELSTIHKIQVMEDWIFDYNYSDFRVRIVAIAPIFMLQSSGIDLGEQALFWIKMDDARHVLKGKEVFNPGNDARNLSFDDWFEKRMFASYIVKESNVFDTPIKYQPEFENDGIAQLLEADRIKNDLFIFEHDNWEY